MTQFFSPKLEELARERKHVAPQPIEQMATCTTSKLIEDGSFGRMDGVVVYTHVSATCKSVSEHDITCAMIGSGVWSLCAHVAACRPPLFRCGARCDTCATEPLTYTRAIIEAASSVTRCSRRSHEFR